MLQLLKLKVGKYVQFIQFYPRMRMRILDILYNFEMLVKFSKIKSGSLVLFSNGFRATHNSFQYIYYTLFLIQSGKLIYLFQV